jgi:Predicted AAA-ATPase/PD-(D/E)XK nuclease superfamily
MNHRRKLPIGIQTLRIIREGGYYYVDKTAQALELIEEGRMYFLSRPRRFGKSLFLDTLKELFEGHRDLFTGLYADTHWDWTRRYPVIRISFGGGVVHAPDGLNQLIRDILRVNREALGVTRPPDIPAHEVAIDLAALIRQAHQTHGERVVVLVDEYDKPILDNITDSARATEMREALKGLYSVLKDSDAHLQFVFLTGVSKFSKVSLFSGLNHLKDITLDARYSAICGYTDEDVDTVFSPELPGLDREEIRRWYNGYNWLGQGVYNPFDMLLLFDKREFQPYWFETGTPTFLVKLLAERQFFTPDLSQVMAMEQLIASFDVDDIPPEALLFQTGYLTLRGREEISRAQWVYTLGYPNREVETSLNTALLKGYGVPDRQALTTRLQLLKLLKAGDAAGLQALFHALFASIPHDWYRKNKLAEFEGHYASVFYSYFAASGLDIRLEDATNHGRIDMAVLCHDAVWLFEFKVVELVPEGHALAQLHARGYAEKYRAAGQPIHLIGVEFSRATRNVVGFEVETLGGP